MTSDQEEGIYSYFLAKPHLEPSVWVAWLISHNTVGGTSPVSWEIVCWPSQDRNICLYTPVLIRLENFLCGYDIYDIFYLYVNLYTLNNTKYIVKNCLFLCWKKFSLLQFVVWQMVLESACRCTTVLECSLGILDI